MVSSGKSKPAILPRNFVSSSTSEPLPAKLMVLDSAAPPLCDLQRAAGDRRPRDRAARWTPPACRRSRSPWHWPCRRSTPLPGRPTPTTVPLRRARTVSCRHSRRPSRSRCRAFSTVCSAARQIVAPSPCRPMTRSCCHRSGSSCRSPCRRWRRSPGRPRSARAAVDAARRHQFLAAAAHVVPLAVPPFSTVGRRSKHRRAARHAARRHHLRAAERDTRCRRDWPPDDTVSVPTEPTCAPCGHAAGEHRFDAAGGRRSCRSPCRPTARSPGRPTPRSPPSPCRPTTAPPGRRPACIEPLVLPPANTVTPPWLTRRRADIAAGETSAGRPRRPSAPLSAPPAMLTMPPA